MRGLALILLRLIIVAIFLVGVLKSLAESAGKVRSFLRSFSVYGGAFLASWPATIVFAELFLPNYMHREVVTLVDEASQIIAVSYLCRLFALPKSAYIKVNLKDEDDASMPDYVRSRRR